MQYRKDQMIPPLTYAPRSKANPLAITVTGTNSNIPPTHRKQPGRDQRECEERCQVEKRLSLESNRRRQGHVRAACTCLNLGRGAVHRSELIE